MRPNPRICRICSWLSSFWLTPRTPANTDSWGDLVPVSHRKSLLCQLYSHKNAQFSHLNKNDENYNKRRWVVSILGLKAFCFGLVHTKNYKTQSPFVFCSFSLNRKDFFCMLYKYFRESWSKQDLKIVRISARLSNISEWVMTFCTWARVSSVRQTQSETKTR